jgi:hypothetical protein
VQKGNLHKLIIPQPPTPKKKMLANGVVEGRGSSDNYDIRISL